MIAILQVCINIEERVGEIYQQLTQHPQADDELRAIWQTMAEEEMRHAERIRSVGTRLEQAGVKECGLTDLEARGLFDRAGSILDDVQEGRLSLEEAIYASVDLEDSFLRAHLSFSDLGDQPDLQTMFKSLAEADREHTERLHSYLKRINDGHGLQFEDGEQE